MDYIIVVGISQKNNQTQSQQTDPTQFTILRFWPGKYNVPIMSLSSVTSVFNRDYVTLNRR